MSSKKTANHALYGMEQILVFVCIICTQIDLRYLSIYPNFWIVQNISCPCFKHIHNHENMDTKSNSNYITICVSLHSQFKSLELVQAYFPLPVLAEGFTHQPPFKKWKSIEHPIGEEHMWMITVIFVVAGGINYGGTSYWDGQYTHPSSLPQNLAFSVASLTTSSGSTLLARLRSSLISVSTSSLLIGTITPTGWSTSPPQLL